MSPHGSFAHELARVPLFADLGPEDLDHLARVAARLHEPAGETLTKEGERGDELMIVLEGEVEIRHGGRVVAGLTAGDYLGEVALLEDDARRSATAVARTAVVLAFLSRHDFANLCSAVPALAQRVKTTEAERLAERDGPA
jgi:CRP-like cAMP-binding protein